MEEYTNPYWDEIKERLDEVTDGMSLSVGLPSRRKRYEQIMSAGTTALNLLTSNPYERTSVDPATFMQRYTQSLYYRRNEFCAKYCWAVPDPDTLDFLVQWCGSSVVEIGAGTGYFAWQLAQRGIQVYAYDIAPPHISWENEYHSPRDENHRLTRETREVYYPIEIGGPAQCADHPNQTLFLCWPPMSDMAMWSLKYYTGDRLITIGESDGGCTADSDFFTLLEESWREVADHKPIQWDGIHDYVQVFERGKEGV